MQASLASSSTSLLASTSSSSSVQQRPFQRAFRAARPASRVVVRAAGDVPKGVTMPPVQPTVPPATFGFVDNAERMNSRAAMIGFFSLILVEAIIGQGLLEAIGLTVGKGLGFEF